MRFTVATYNIHKGFSQLNRRMVIHELRERLHGLVRRHPVPAGGRGRPPAARRRATSTGRCKPQHEFIADTVWHEVAYGKNAIYRHGHHGNAVLSRFPIVAQENQDISAHAFESRGLLHCDDQARAGRARRCTASTSTWGCSSAGGSGRSARCASASARRCPTDAPLVIAGDFNDWRHKANRLLVEELGVVEVFEAVRGRPARTFPSVLPVFRLDRIYARGLDDRRRARPLRVSVGTDLRPRGAGGHVRDRQPAPR